MAKSIKSKWRKKMRNVKREKIAKRDLVKLKQIIDVAESTDADMKELYTVKTADQLKVEQAQKADEMEVDSTGKKYHPKTLKDEHGQYPPWMNQRKIKKHKKTLKSKVSSKKTKTVSKKKKGTGAW